MIFCASQDSSSSLGIVHVLHIGFRVTTTAAATASDDDWAARFRQFLRPHEQSLRARGLRRLTFTILPARAGDHPSYFTYRHSLDYDEVSFLSIFSNVIKIFI